MFLNKTARHSSAWANDFETLLIVVDNHGKTFTASDFGLRRRDDEPVGVADEKWGKIVAAFVKRNRAVSDVELEQFCRTSGLANFKRPRRYVFVDAIPKSPVGKLLRRLLVAGEYEAERLPPSDAA